MRTIVVSATVFLTIAGSFSFGIALAWATITHLLRLLGHGNRAAAPTLEPAEAKAAAPRL